MSARIIFLGPPGAGKGTQAGSLAALCEIPIIGTGEMLRQAIADQTELGKKAQGYVDEGDLVPDNLILDLIRERLSQPDAKNGWILDGFPRNVNQAAFLDHLLADMQQECHYVIDLEVPDEVILDRLLHRGRKDDNEHTIEHRLDVYRQQTAPVIDYYKKQGTLFAVPGDRTSEEVTQALQQIIKN